MFKFTGKMYNAYKRWRTPVPKALVRTASQSQQARPTRTASRLTPRAHTSTTKVPVDPGVAETPQDPPLSTGLPRVPVLRKPQNTTHSTRSKRSNKSSTSKSRQRHYARAATCSETSEKDASGSLEGFPVKEYEKQKLMEPTSSEFIEEQRAQIQDAVDLAKEIAYQRNKIRKPYCQLDNILKRDREVAYMLLMRELREAALKEEEAERLEMERQEEGERESVTEFGEVEEGSVEHGKEKTRRTQERGHGLREARAEHRTHPESAHSPSPTDIGACFDIYQRKWDLLTCPTDELPDIIAVTEVPWPVLGKVEKQEDITFALVREFVLHPDRPGLEGISLEKRLRMDMRMWQPDKFATRVLNRLAEHDVAPAKECAAKIVQWLSIIIQDIIDDA